jgi:hypothetical protein
MTLDESAHGSAPNTLVVVKPDWRPVAPGLVLGAFVWLMFAVVAVIAIRHPKDVLSLLMPVIAIAIPLYAVLYFKNSKIVVDDDGLKHTNFLGMTSLYSRGQFGKVDVSTGYGGYSQYKVQGTDGRVWFRLNGRAWDSDSMIRVARAMEAQRS